MTRFDLYDGVLIVKEASARAKELLAVAQHHKLMMDMIDNMVEGNDYFALFMGHGLMIYAILAHHGRIKADDALLMQCGYHPAQVLAGLNDDTSSSNNGTTE